MLKYQSVVKSEQYLAIINKERILPSICDNGSPQQSAEWTTRDGQTQKDATIG